jgi:O-antigen ligase
MISPAYLALWIFVFVLPWEGIVASAGISILARLTGMVAFGLALLAIVMTGRVRRLHKFHVAALLFVVWAGIGLFMIERPEMPPKYFTYVQLLLASWIIWELAPSMKRVHGLLLAYVLGGYVAALETVMLYRKGIGGLRRFSATGDPNDLAMTLALGLPLAWYLGTVYRQPILRWVCRGYLPVGLIAIGLTASRGGMVASLIGLLVVPLTMTRLSPGRLATAIGMLVLSGALAVAYVPDKTKERLATTGTELEEANLGGRFRIWSAGLNAFALKPLVGYGTSGFKKAVQPWGVGQVAHNSYLSVLVEQGAIGFLFYAAMLWAVFRSVLKLPVRERRFALVTLATLCTAMLPLTWEDRRVPWFIMAGLLGLARAYRPELLAAFEQPPRPVPSAYSQMAARRMAAPGLRSVIRDDRA